jgi:hypothetical protein
MPRVPGRASCTRQRCLSSAGTLARPADYVELGDQSAH